MSELNLRDIIEEAEVRIIRANPEYQALKEVARALQDAKNYFANSTTSSGNVFLHPYFQDGIRHAYKNLKEVEHLLD